MLNSLFTGAEKIIIACGYTDFRKQSNSLVQNIRARHHELVFPTELSGPTFTDETSSKCIILVKFENNDEKEAFKASTPFDIERNESKSFGPLSILKRDEISDKWFLDNFNMNLK